MAKRRIGGPKPDPGLRTVGSVSGQPVIEVKHLWSDPWQLAPDIQLLSATRMSAGRGISEMRLRREYGPKVKRTFEDVYHVASPRDITHWWVKMSLVNEQGEAEQFIGRIVAEPRRVFSNKTDAIGVQEWTVRGPLELLRKIHVADSVWKEGATVKTIGWLPPMNYANENRTVIGNRTEQASGNSYLYGGGELWSRRQYADYLLARFADQLPYGGPAWVLGGDVQVLDAMTDSIDWGAAMSLLDMLRRLIATGAGMDFNVRLSPLGFELNVFLLNARSASFGGATVPTNQNHFALQPADMPEGTRFTINQSLVQQYDRLTIQGARIVVCATLNLRDGDFERKWSTALENLYKDPGVGDDPDKLADARKADVFRSVFRMLGTHDAWLHKAGQASVATDNNGNPLPGANYQNLMKSTLSWIPVFEADPQSPGPLHLLNAGAAVFYEGDDRPNAYIPIEALGGHLGVASEMLGVFLDLHPAHLLGIRDWADAIGDDTEPIADYQFTECTLAWRSDHRLRLHFELTDGTSPIGDHLVVTDDQAELWYILPGTVVGVNPDGTLKRTSGAVVVRNDSGRLAPMMAAMIARHHFQRVQATIELEGLWMRAHLIGSVLSVIEQGPGQAQPVFVQSPVTSVEWQAAPRDGGHPKTIIRTGHS